MFKSKVLSFNNQTNLSNQIKEYSNVLPEDVLFLSFEYLKFSEKTPKTRAGLGSSSTSTPHTDFFVRDAYFVNCESPLFLPIRDSLRLNITKRLHTYLSQLKLHNSFNFKNLKADSDFSFVTYEPFSKGYKPHVDTVTQTYECSKRLFSCVYYLNDNYTGGELYFPNINKTIKPKKNSCVIFPSSHLYSHTALAVRNARKVICPAWFGYELPEEFKFGSIL